MRPWPGVRPRGWCAAALLAVGLPWVAVGLFEDEVGQYEWVLQQVGKPTALAYSADASDRIFVASASGVVASVLLKDGAMQWRRVATAQGGVRLLRAASRGLLSVTDSGVVQAWKGSTGDLTWQREYLDPVVDLLVAGAGSRQNVVIVRAEEVEARTMAGKHEWSATPAQAGPKARFWAAASAPDESAVCALAAAADGTGAVSLHVETATGKVLKKAELPASVATGLARGSFMVVDAQLVLLDDNKLSAVPLCGGTSSSDFQLSKLKAKGSGGTLRLMPWQRTPGVFAATNGATTAIFGLGAKGLKHLRTFEGVAVVGPIFSVHEDETGQPVAVAIIKAEGTQIQLMDPASGNVQPAIHAPGYAASDHGPAQLLLVHELSSGEHRTVISAADHSFAGIQGAKVMWLREEGLASIRQAVFYSRSAAATVAERLARPTEANSLAALGAQLTGLPGRLAELVQQPAELVAAFTAWVTPRRRRSSHREMRLMPNVRVPTSSEELRDFGADKLVLAATRSSKLFAIEATTSEIVWQKYLGPSSEECSAAGTETLDACSPWLQLLPSGAAPISELLVIAPAAGGGQQILWIEPLTGKVLHQEASPAGSARVASIMPLMPKHSHELPPPHKVQPFILIDSQHRVHALPVQSAEARRLAQESAHRLFHYEVDTAGQAVQGFVLNGAGGEGQRRLELLRLWNLELGSAGERVLAAAAPEHREWDHVPVHIKGDATILYKYINPNLLAVVTEDAGDNASTALNLYALDAVTGHVLHQSHIVGGAGPVQLVACDNWIILHYQNPKRTRFEIAVVELFQAKADDGPWDIIFGGRQVLNHTKSAHHLDTPVPLQQTYIFPAGVTAMGVTATLKGITPRSIIMALTTEHVFRVSKDMLNPRRPYVTGATIGPAGKEKAAVPAQFAPSKEEALPPYAPLLPLRHTDVLTYYNPTGKVEGVISSPSALESTSLVFCYGLDLFFVPVQSAKAYDVLSPGFNYVLLYLSVGLVVAIWVATSFWASRKALQDRWK